MNAISSTKNKRVIVIANKNWEMAPLMNVLLEPRACPAGLAWPTTLNPLTEWQAGSRPKTVADISNPIPRASTCSQSIAADTARAAALKVGGKAGRLINTLWREILHEGLQPEPAEPAVGLRSARPSL